MLSVCVCGRVPGQVVVFGLCFVGRGSDGRPRDFWRAGKGSLRMQGTALVCNPSMSARAVYGKSVSAYNMGHTRTRTYRTAASAASAGWADQERRSAHDLELGRAREIKSSGWRLCAFGSWPGALAFNDVRRNHPRMGGVNLPECLCELPSERMLNESSAWLRDSYRLGKVASFLPRCECSMWRWRRWTKTGRYGTARRRSVAVVPSCTSMIRRYVMSEQ